MLRFKFSSRNSYKSFSRFFFSKEAFKDSSIDSSSKLSRDLEFIQRFAQISLIISQGVSLKISLSVLQATQVEIHEYKEI